MKVKLNLDKETIKTFLLEHTEKIVFGAFVVCFVLIVYSAIGRETFDRTPGQLGDAARTADEHIERTPPPESEGIEGQYGPKVAGWRENPIKVDAYQHANLWDPAVFDPQGPRDDPPLLVVEELRGSEGSGAFGMKLDGAAGISNASQTQGRRWVVLTGLVNYDSQVQAFRRCFQHAEYQAGSPREPTYLGFVVERATVDGSEAVEALDWSKTFQFSKRTRVATLAKWAETPKDVVDAKFINESFTYPLGPLLGRTWGREVAHYDQIPLIDASAEETPERATEEGPTDPGGDIFNVAAPTPRAAPAQVEVADPNASDGYRLFRFFDFEVEPGKQYRYRVRLVVSNPNYQVPDRFLVNAASAKPVYVMSEFSAPSDVISVSHDSRVYVVSVKPPLRVKDNPSGTVRAQRFVLATGEIASEEFPVAVGKVMNFYATGATSRQPRAAAGDLGDDREQGAAASAPVDYVTEALAVDLQGGESLYDRSGLTSPGELLVLGRDNRLVWQNEFVDAEAFKASVASGAGSESGSRQDNMFDPSAADQGLNGVFQ